MQRDTDVQKNCSSSLNDRFLHFAQLQYSCCSNIFPDKRATANCIKQYNVGADEFRFASFPSSRLSATTISSALRTYKLCRDVHSKFTLHSKWIVYFCYTSAVFYASCHWSFHTYVKPYDLTCNTLFIYFFFLTYLIWPTFIFFSVPLFLFRTTVTFNVKYR